MDRRIEGRVGLLKDPRFPKKLHTFRSNETDNRRIRGEVEVLTKEAKRRIMAGEITEKSWSMHAFNNVYAKFGEPMRAMLMQFEEDSPMEEGSKWKTASHKERGASEEHSQHFLEVSPAQFYRDIDNAAEAVGLNPQREIWERIAAGIALDEIYERTKIFEAYEKLRSWGYSHLDLTR
jgi:hypothetical protein